MTRHATSLVLAYHGCEENVGREAVSHGMALKGSDRDYDWLGPGIYFWENDPVRAMEWARSKANRGEIRVPYVVGAVIDLGNCLDLLLRENIQLLGLAYESFAALRTAGGLPIPENRDVRTKLTGDKPLRYRDCAVIRHLHAMIETQDLARSGDEEIEPFDTVRGLFVEGEPAYPGGGFYEKSHTQVAVRKEQCIKGLFLPRDVA